METKLASLNLTPKQLQSLLAPSRQLVEKIARNWEPQNALDLPPTTPLFARRVLKHADLVVDNEFWDVLQEEHGFELWSNEMEYLLGCGKFISLTSYSAQELRDNSWFDLFERDPIHTKQIIGACQKVLATNKMVLQVTPPHIVTEKFSSQKVSILVTVKGIFPVWMPDDRSTPACLIGLTEFKRLS